MLIKYLYLLSSVGAVGLIVFILGIFGLLRPFFIFPLLLPLLWFASSFLKSLLSRFPTFTRNEVILIGLISLQLLVYSLGLFVPETGYDALWYHLPQAQVYASTGKIAQIPELLYSTMPRLGEMYFTLAWLISPTVFSVKLVSFFFSVCFILTTYFLAHHFLSRSPSLLTALVINSLYVVSWQATSAYVDLPRAVFELTSLLCLVKFADQPLRRFADRWFILSALFSGFALSVKMQSFIHVFVVLFVLIFSTKSFKLVTRYLVLVTLIAFPWYLVNYLQTGSPIYPLNLPAKQLDQLSYAGASSLSGWLVSRTLTLPRLFYDLTFHPRDLLSPIFLILLPILLIKLKSLVHHPFHLFLILYSTFSLIFWWFLPPPETRYLLSALPPLIILELWSVNHFARYRQKIKNISYIFVFLSVGINLLLRSYSSQKYLPVIFNQITPSDYINSQTSPYNRTIVEKFYSGYWLHYQY